MSVVPDGNGGYRAMTKEEKEKVISDRNKVLPKLNAVEFAQSFPITAEECFSVRKISIKLFGIPMPKQSVRQGVNIKTGQKMFFPDTKTIGRKEDYIRQIQKQLPTDFKMFEHEVHLKKFHCIFPPLKAFHKIKGRMEAIRAGKIFYKNTKPDLIDNLKKLAFDSMSGIVLKDDSIIVTENDTAKYYGEGGCIIIELEGY